jgi:hypothetical protein
VLIATLPIRVEASIPAKQAAPARVGWKAKALVARESASTGRHETTTEVIQKGIIAV